MTMTQTREQSPHLAAPMRRPLQPGSPPPGITPRDIWRIILKRKWLIILSFVICTAMMGTVTLLWWKFARGYTATALLAVSPPPATMMQVGTPQYTKDVIERNKRSQAALVKHQSVLSGVADDRRFKDASTPAGKWLQKHREDLAQELDEEINVSLMPETNLIRLSMTGTNRGELADIVNAMADSFVRHTEGITRRRRAGPIGKLQIEKDNLERRLREVRGQLAAAIRNSDIAAMQGRQSTIAIKLRMLTQQIHEAEMELSTAETAAKSYEDAVKDGSIVNDPQIRYMIDMDYTLRSLKARMVEMETSLYNAEQKFGPKHRQVKDIRGIIQAIKDQIATREKEVFGAQAGAMGATRRMQKDAAVKQLADLKNRLNEVRAEARGLERTLGNIEAFRQEIEDIQIRITRVGTRLRDLRMLGSRRPGEVESETGPVTVHAYATEPRPDEWTRPRVAVLIPLGVVLGLVIGFGLAFLLEFMDTSVKSPSDLAKRVDLPLLGMVPHGDDLDEEIGDFRRVTSIAPHSPAAEAFRQIRTNLLFSGPAQQRRSLLVTSPAPQDGRTSVTMNLAVSMAQAGRKVLVVDANFRRPAVAEMFPQAKDAGLSSALVGQAAWRDVVSTTDVPNLSVITSGPLPPNPTELLGSDSMGKIASEMADEYDQVIFDGSPLMVVADACVLGTQVDGVILVVRAGVNSTGIVQRSADRLNRVGARVLGVVLQGVRSTSGGYLRKNYETFYEYHQKPLT